MSANSIRAVIVYEHVRIWFMLVLSRQVLFSPIRLAGLLNKWYQYLLWSTQKIGCH